MSWGQTKWHKITVRFLMSWREVFNSLTKTSEVKHGRTMARYQRNGHRFLNVIITRIRMVFTFANERRSRLCEIVFTRTCIYNETVETRHVAMRKSWGKIEREKNESSNKSVAFWKSGVIIDWIKRENWYETV